MAFNHGITTFLNKVAIRYREQMNPILGPYRRRKLYNKNFTIISNNCWAGHVYRYFNLPYNSPTIGLYFFPEDYLKFIQNLGYYLSLDLTFIPYDESKHRDKLIAKGGQNLQCPIGKLNDIEIIFLHYKTNEDAQKKWNRRKKRICWENIYVKMSEQNNCKEEHIHFFDSIEYRHKIIFTHKDYRVNSQIIVNTQENEVRDDTTHFRRYINVIKWLNNHHNYKLKQ